MRLQTRDEFENAVNNLLGVKFPLLSDGSVELIDAMGSDARIVQAARTTSNIDAPSEKDDVNLVRYLLRHRHGTPFEFPHVCLKVVCPMDTWRQWIRHRTANVNEFSTRYSTPPDLADKTPPDKWRKQATTNRQGSSGEFVDTYPPGYEAGANGMNPPPGVHLSSIEAEFQAKAREVYEERLKFGVAKEQARKDLPLSTYTTAYWQSDLRNLLGFLSLRMDGHAQWEIRQYANVIGEKIIAKLYPVTWQAFLDYDLNSMRLTALDIQVIQELSEMADLPCTSEEFFELQHPAWRGMEKCRERDECRAKLQKLGLVQEE